MDRIPLELIPSICDCMENKDLLSMALSSHVLMEPALDALWKEINSFRPLICCLPSDLLKEQLDADGGRPTHHPRREVRSHDLERYTRVYAPRIRIINTELYLNTLSTGVLQGLYIATRFVPGALSPNVQVLHWSVVAFKGTQNLDLAASHISLFAGELLSDLKIFAMPGDSLPLYVSAVFLTIGRLPALKKLDVLFMLSPLPGCVSMVNKLVTAYPWESLQSLRMQTVLESTLKSVSALPRLESLALWGQKGLPLRYALGHPPTYPSPASFASLETFVIDSMSLIPVVALLQHFPLTNRLRSLIVSTTGEDPSLEATQGFFTAIRNHANPSTFIDIYLEMSGLVNPPTELIESPIVVDQLTDISPLFSFKKLRQIYLGGSLLDCRFGPSHVAELIVALPEIETLHIVKGDLSWNTPPSLGFDHIVQLAQGLPQLQFLGLYFDATQVRGDELAPGGPFRSLETLSVHWSPILSPSRVLRCLRANFPNLRTLEHRPDLVP